MNRTLTKSIVVLVALVLCATCIGSAFAIYTITDNRHAIISFFAPDNYYLESDWGGWVADNTTKMTYSAGTYVKNDVTINGGQGFKIYTYDAENSAHVYINSVANMTVPYYIDGWPNYNVILSNDGTYDFTYSPSTGNISVSADVLYCTFKCVSWVTDASAVIFAKLYDTDENSGVWIMCNNVGYDNESPLFRIECHAEYANGLKNCKLYRYSSSSDGMPAGTLWNQTSQKTINANIIDTTSNW